MGCRRTEVIRTFQKSRIKSGRWPRIKSGRQGNTSSRGETGPSGSLPTEPKTPGHTGRGEGGGVGGRAPLVGLDRGTFLSLILAS